MIPVQLNNAADEEVSEEAASRFMAVWLEADRTGQDIVHMLMGRLLLAFDGFEKWLLLLHVGLDIKRDGDIDNAGEWLDPIDKKMAGELFKKLTERKYLNKNDRSLIAKAINVRNDVVHSYYDNMNIRSKALLDSAIAQRKVVLDLCRRIEIIIDAAKLLQDMRSRLQIDKVLASDDILEKQAKVASTCIYTKRTVH